MAFTMFFIWHADRHESCFDSMQHGFSMAVRHYVSLCNYMTKAVMGLNGMDIKVQFFSCDDVRAGLE